MMRRPIIVLAALLPLAIAAGPTTLPTTSPTTAPASLIQFPSVTVDRAARQVRVECQALAIDAPLEFFCVTNGGSEHESVLRTPAKPSHIHAGLLMLGLQPGSPVMYVESKNAWSAPYGPPLRVSVEWKDVNGQLIHKPAEALMRSTNDAKTPVPPMRWIFAGSHVRDDGTYLADLTGYVVTLCNFEHALIDVPRLVSSANETLQWQTDNEHGPQRGDAVTMIIEPVDDETRQPTTQSSATSADSALDADGITPSQATEMREIASMREQWRIALAPHRQAMHDAAQAHYAVIAQLRAKEKQLTDEADRIEALIDELDRTYAELTEPKP